MPRQKKEEVSFVLPSNPTDLQAIRDSIYEIEGALTFINDKKEYIKDVYAMLNERFQMPKDLVGKLVKAHQDDKYDEMVEKHQEFEVAYDKIMSFDATMDGEDSE